MKKLKKLTSIVATPAFFGWFMSAGVGFIMGGGFENDSDYSDKALLWTMFGVFALTTIALSLYNWSLVRKEERPFTLADCGL